MIKVKRIYDPVADEDGYRVLVDRLWPRGISKAGGQIDLWVKEIAPSNELRKWYQHDPDKWDSFRTRYFSELDRKTELLDPLLNKIKAQDVTLVFSSRETRLNNAFALKEYLELMTNA